MRRARIKASAAVPVRKRLVQDTTASIDTNDIPNKKEEKEDISDVNEADIATQYIPIIKEPEVKDTFSTNDSSNKELEKDTTSTNDGCIIECNKEPEKDIPIAKDASNKESDISSASDISNKEKKEVALDIDKTQIDEKDISKIEERKEEDISSIITIEQDAAKYVKNVQEEIVTQEQNKGNLAEPKPIGAGKSNYTPGSSITDIVSPTKNRTCFMRPTPRLNSGGRVRKNSVQGSGASASESEDEHGKRVASIAPSLIRNDSVCSVQSNRESIANDNQNNSPRIRAMQKRRMMISESARRLAEARREFLLKHENRTPDRSQLTMYDLIYYNPVTNPMPKKSIEQRQPRAITPPPVEILEEEDEDDPSGEPAPQVKVGPNGQLIVDEQSLVIQTTDAKRNRKILETEVIIDDGSCRGFYKKHKRSKDWPTWETLKFYRVLNVVGTDFLLMQTHFPNRTRLEIKQKYKKEERVNRQLVEKVLKYHQEFNTEKLEEQLAMLQKLENTQNIPKKTSEKIRSEQCTTKIARKRRHRLVANSIGECEALSINVQEAEDVVVSDEIDTEINSEANSAQHQQIKKGSKGRKMKRRLNDEYDEFDDNSSYASLNGDSDSSPEVYRVRPTRSGRQPRKVHKLQAPDINVTCDSDAEDETPINDGSSHVTMEITEVVNTPIGDIENAESITNVIPNINQMEPGSLVIVSKESTEDPGNTILQVYMVSSNIDSANTTVASDGTPVDSSLNHLSTNKTEDNAELNNAANHSEK